MRNCHGRGDFTFRLCWPSGECVQRYENVGDLPIERLIQDMHEGLIEGLPKATTTIEGDWLQSYHLLWDTEILQNGTLLSDYHILHDATFTIVLHDHTA